MNRPYPRTGTTLSDELKLLPPAAWWTAGFIFAGFLLAGWLILSIAVLDRSTPSPPVPVSLLLAVGPLVPGFLIAVLVLLIFYVNADAGRRMMNRPLWTLLVILVPYMIGFIIYFLVRKPLPSPCPACGAPVTETHNFCPSCGENVARVCPYCHQAIEEFWSNCAHCGKPLPEGAREAPPG